MGPRQASRTDLYAKQGRTHALDEGADKNARVFSFAADDLNTAQQLEEESSPLASTASGPPSAKAAPRGQAQAAAGQPLYNLDRNGIDEKIVSATANIGPSHTMVNHVGGWKRRGSRARRNSSNASLNKRLADPRPALQAITAAQGAFGTCFSPSIVNPPSSSGTKLSAQSSISERFLANEGHPFARSRSASHRTTEVEEPPLTEEEKEMKRERIRSNFRRIIHRVRFANKLFITGVPPYHRFVPRTLYRVVAEQIDTRSPFESGRVEHGAVLFADCSGFTRLTSRLAAKGKGGAEQLCDILRRFFQVIIDIAHMYGGDIIKFAGDAVTIVFFQEELAKAHDLQTGLRVCARRAALCALQMLDRCPYTAIDDPDPANQVDLNLHIGLGAGAFASIQVGGVFDCWEYLLAGPPLAQIAISEPTALSGQVVASPEVVELIQDCAEFIQPDLVPHVTKASKNGVPLTPSEIGPYLGAFRRLVHAEPHGISTSALKEPVVSHAVGSRLSRYVPKVVRTKMDRSKRPYDIAELRQVSVLFVKITGLELDPESNNSCQSAIDNAQLLMQELQRVVFNYEGVINKLLVDDKGLLAIAVFGLPPFMHQDDAARAVGAGIAIYENIPRLKQDTAVAAAVGITTGRVFAGIIGSRERHEYTVMGDSVNKAARLMASADPYGVLIDETTRTDVLAQVSSFSCDEVPELELKGFTKKMRAFRPHDIHDKLGDSLAMQQERSGNMLFGREDDIQVAVGMLNRLHNKRGGIIYIKADVAMGTTPVALKMSAAAANLGMVVIAPSPSQTLKIGDYGTEQLKRSRHNMSSCIDTDSKWSIWCSVLKEAFKHLKAAGVPSLRTWVLECLEPFDDQIDLTWTLPALESVLKKFEAPPPVQQTPRHTSIIRDSDVESLIVRVLLGFASLFPTFIALRLDVQKHDGHGALDHYSWQVAERLAAHCQSREDDEDAPPFVVMVMSEHQNEDSPFASYDILRRATSDNTLLRLGLLNKKQRLRWAAQCLSFQKPKDVVVFPASVPPAITQLLDYRCGGHPWMIHKTISIMFSHNACGHHSGPALRKWPSGRISILAEDLSHVKVTEDMAKCLLTSYESLNARLQSVAKAAAVMPAFSPEMVFALTSESPAHVLQRELDDLVERGILVYCRTVPRCVDNYWPSDRTTAYHYEFACKLQQRLIVDITPLSTTQRYKRIFFSRISKVTYSVMTIQAAWRRHLATVKPKLQRLANGKIEAIVPPQTGRMAKAAVQLMRQMQRLTMGEDGEAAVTGLPALRLLQNVRRRADSSKVLMTFADRPNTDGAATSEEETGSGPGATPERSSGNDDTGAGAAVSSFFVDDEEPEASSSQYNGSASFSDDSDNEREYITFEERGGPGCALRTSTPGCQGFHSPIPYVLPHGLQQQLRKRQVDSSPVDSTPVGQADMVLHAVGDLLDHAEVRLDQIDERCWDISAELDESLKTLSDMGDSLLQRLEAANADSSLIAAASAELR